MPEIDWFGIRQWIHIVTGASWLGAVVLINFVIVPALAKIEHRARRLNLAPHPESLLVLSSAWRRTTWRPDGSVFAVFRFESVAYDGQDSADT